MTGDVEAVVARLDVVINGKAFAPGCVLPGRLVLMSMLGHVADRGDPAVGMGTIVEEGPHLVFRGRCDVHTPRGAKAHEIIRYAGDRGRWSLTWRPLRWELAYREGQRIELVELAHFYEVGLTLKAADPLTHTIATDPPFTFNPKRIPWN